MTERHRVITDAIEHAPIYCPDPTGLANYVESALQERERKPPGACGAPTRSGRPCSYPRSACQYRKQGIHRD